MCNALGILMHNLFVWGVGQVVQVGSGGVRSRWRKVGVVGVGEY